MIHAISTDSMFTSIISKRHNPMKTLRTGFPRIIFIALVLAGVLLTAEPASAQGNSVSDAAFKNACQGVRDAIAARDIALAKRKLQEASQNLTTVESQNRYTRLTLIVDYIDQFWSLLRQGMENLDAPTEMLIGSTQGMVVDASRDRIVLRGAGKRYEYHWTQIGRNIAIAICERSFENSPESKATVGIFLLFDAKGDKTSGMKLLREAIKGRVPDLDMVIDEVEGRPTLGGTTTGPPNGGNTNPGGNTPPVNPGGGNTSPGHTRPVNPTPVAPPRNDGLDVPKDAANLKKARESIIDVLRPHYEAATAKYKQTELAELLISLPGRSDKIRDNAYLHYIALTEARDMAAKAGNAEVCFEAIDKIDAIFSVDVTHEKMLMMEPLTKSISTTRALSDLAFAAIRLAIEAHENKHKDAKRLAELALEAARKSKNRKYMEGAAEVLRRISSGR